MRLFPRVTGTIGPTIRTSILMPPFDLDMTGDFILCVKRGVTLAARIAGMPMVVARLGGGVTTGARIGEDATVEVCE